MTGMTSSRHNHQNSASFFLFSQTLQKHWLLIGLAGISIHGMLLVNRIHIPGPIFVLETSIDQILPLIPVFIVPYLFFFGYVNFTWFYLIWRAPSLVRSCAHTLIYTGSMTTILNLLVQTNAPRVALSLESIWERLLHWHYGLNYAFTSLPSLHVSLSVIAGYYLTKVHGKGWLFHSLTLLIASSTLFLKQHHIIDVLVAVILAYGSAFIFDHWFEHKQKRAFPLKKLPRWQQPRFGLTLITLIAGLLVITGIVTAQKQSEEWIDEILTENHRNTRGSYNAPEHLMIFIDYSKHESWFAQKEIELRYDDESYFLSYKYYPTYKDSTSHFAAQAVETAAQQGFFWEMHRLVLNEREYWISIEDENQIKLFFTQLAQEIEGLDYTRFEQELYQERYREIVDLDQRDGLILDIQKAPAIYRNGEIQT